MATIVGGFLGAAVVWYLGGHWWVWIGNDISHACLDPGPSPPWYSFHCNDHVYSALAAVFLAGVVLVSSTSAGASVRLVRAGAALETAMAALLLVGGMGVRMFLVDLYFAVLGWPLAPALLVAALLLLARWLGVAWHRRRAAAPASRALQSTPVDS